MLHDIGRYASITEIETATNDDLKVSRDVTLTVVWYDGVTGYCLSARHAGSDVTWYWDSGANGLQVRDTAACPVTTSGTAGDTVTG